MLPPLGQEQMINNLGPAGEHLVMSELLLLGHTPALTPPGIRGVDIIVATAECTPLATVQVKSCSGNGGWRMSPGHETAHAGLFFAFVDFGRRPAEVFVVPSEVIATLVRRSHDTWLRLNPARGENNIRKVQRRYGFPVEGFGDDWIERYRDAWHQLDDYGSHASRAGGVRTSTSNRRRN